MNAYNTLADIEPIIYSELALISVHLCFVVLGLMYIIIYGTRR